MIGSDVGEVAAQVLDRMLGRGRRAGHRGRRARTRRRPGRPAGRPPAPGPPGGRACGARRGAAALPGPARGGVTVPLDDPIRTGRRPATDRQGARGRVWACTRWGPAAALPAPVRRARRADRPRVAARGRHVTVLAEVAGTRMFEMQNRQGWRARGGRHRRAGPAAADVLREEARDGRLARTQLYTGRQGLFAGKVGVVQRAAPADPPGLRAGRATRTTTRHRRGHRSRRGGGVRRAGSSRSTRRPRTSRRGSSPRRSAVVLDTMGELPDPVPADVLPPSRPPVAVRGVPARPPADATTPTGTGRSDRFVFEEAYVLQVELARRRASGRRAARGAAAPRGPAACSPSSTRGCRSR